MHLIPFLESEISGPSVINDFLDDSPIIDLFLEALRASCTEIVQGQEMRVATALRAKVFENKLDEEVVRYPYIFFYFIRGECQLFETQSVVLRVNEGCVEGETTDQGIGHQTAMLN